VFSACQNTDKAKGWVLE
jgi:hypothetical protein